MLEHLFDAELDYRPGMQPLVDSGEGELIGSGDGRVAGPKIEGTLLWTLFEVPGRLVCSMNPVAVIETGDGARIELEARGFARRRSENDRRWAVAATLLLQADDASYAWLNDALAVWEGEFDANAHRARYRAYLTADAARAADDKED